MSDVAEKPRIPEWYQTALRLSQKPWQISIVNLADLKPMRIDESEQGYQRPLSDSRVQALVDEFDAAEARELYVSKRDDGSMWLLDGQHTCAALRQVGIEQWPARVFEKLTIEEEADRFAQYQNNTRPIPAVVRWNAEVVAGTESVVAIERVLSEFYLRISTSKIRAKDGFLGIGSRAVPEKLYSLGGEKLLRETYQLAIDAWGQNKNSFLGRVLQGMGYLLAYAEGEFDRARMLEVLKNTTGPQIVEGIGATGSGGATRKGAELILNLYLDGTATQPKIRKNTTGAPKLPEKAPKEGPEDKEYWTEDTADWGRTTAEALPPVPTAEEIAAEKAAAKAAKEEAKALAKAEKEAAKAAKAAEKASETPDDTDPAYDPDMPDLEEEDDLDVNADADDADDEDFSYPAEASEAVEV